MTKHSAPLAKLGLIVQTVIVGNSPPYKVVTLPYELKYIPSLELDLINCSA